MSLKVWLPLDGDLRNLGCSDLQFSYSGSNISVNNEGKIGKCYKRTASAADAIISDTPILLGINQSMFCWIKMDSFQSSASLTGILGQHRYSSNTGMGITLRYASASTGYASVNTGTGSSRTYNSYYGSTLLNAGTWYHIGYTYDGSNIRIYVNGNLDKTQIFTNMSCPSEYIQVGNWSFSGTGGIGISNYSAPGSINDVRIYDHCLSPLEVKELSQGLVLHYKLDRKKLQSGTNLVTNITAGGQTTKLTDGRLGVITSGSNADTYFTINLSESITNGTTYTLTCNASGISEGAYWQFPLGAQSNLTLPFKIYNGYNEYTFTANDISWGTNRLLMDDNGRADWANPATFWDFQLYKNETFEVQDNSGYGHNGTIIGDLILNNETSRYTSSTRWNSSSPTDNTETGICYIQTPFSLTTPLQLSITWWAKPESGYGGGTNHAAFCTSNNTSRPTDYNTTAFHHRDSGFDIYPSDGSGVKRLSFVYPKNEWHHYAITYDGTIAKSYKDGVLQTSITVGTNKTLASFSQLYIGYSQAGGVKRKTLGNYSDFRIYCTPLLDNDVKLLYNSSMRVDNLGGIHTFKYQESHNQELLQGIPITNNYGTHSKINGLITYDENNEINLIHNVSRGSDYISISPTNKTYYYDIEVSIDANNQFYFGFERYDANKTSRSNNACTYIIAVKPTTAISHQRYFGTVNLSTDGVNPCAFIALRILNDWSGASNRQAIVHKMSLREVSNLIQPKLNKNGIFNIDELNENKSIKFYKNGIVETTNIIEY